MLLATVLAMAFPVGGHASGLFTAQMIRLRQATDQCKSEIAMTGASGERCSDLVNYYKSVINGNSETWTESHVKSGDIDKSDATVILKLIKDVGDTVSLASSRLP